MITVKSIVQSLTFDVPPTSTFHSLRELKDGSIVFDFDVYLPTVNVNLQRKLIWTLQQKQQFILTMFKELYVPPISCILEMKYGNHNKGDKLKYVIIDGKQRINTMLEFIDDKFQIPTLDGELIFFSGLSEDTQLLLLRYRLSTNTLMEFPDKKLTDIEKYEWFKRVNFSGTPQEANHLVEIQKKIQNSKK